MTKQNGGFLFESEREARQRRLRERFATWPGFFMIMGGSAVVVIITVVIFLSLTNSHTSADPIKQLLPGEAYSTKSFRIWVPEKASARFSRHIGDEYFGLDVEDQGTLFCEIPLCVENITDRTESFGGVTWYLHTDSGLRFEIHSMADLYRDESEQINPYDIPPGISRCGSLVFLVTTTAQTSRILTLEADVFLGRSAEFEVPNRAF